MSPHKLVILTIQETYNNTVSKHQCEKTTLPKTNKSVGCGLFADLPTSLEHNLFDFNLLVPVRCSYFKSVISKHMLRIEFLWNCSLVNAIEHIWWYTCISIGLDNGLMPSGNTPLSEPIFVNLDRAS